MGQILKLSGPGDTGWRSSEKAMDSHEGDITGNAETREDAGMAYL